MRKGCYSDCLTRRHRSPGDPLVRPPGGRAQRLAVLPPRGSRVSQTWLVFARIFKLNGLACRSGPGLLLNLNRRPARTLVGKSRTCGSFLPLGA